MKRNFTQILMLFVDFLSTFSSFLVTLIMFYVMGDKNIFEYIPEEQVSDRFLIHFFISCLLVWIFSFHLKHYSYRKPFWFELKEIIGVVVVLSIIELAIISFSKLYSSRYIWIITWSLTLFFVPLCRILVKNLLIKLKYYLRDTVIVGSGENALDTYKALSDEKYLGLHVTHFIKLSSINCIPNSIKIPVIDESDSVIEQFRGNKDIQFIIALEDGDEHKRNFWLKEFAKNKFKNVSVVPTLRGLPLYGTDMSFIFRHELMLLNINNNLSKLTSRIIKRLVDIFLSATIIISIMPLFIVLYFSIKKDGGNAIYGHKRVGQNGKLFNCLKFRTMVVNSKEILDNLLNNDSEARAEWEKDFKLKNDPRITKIGGFLRRTSLDELPQLFNVLKGDMSLVGPRPIVQEELERYRENLDYYLMAKPGITGLWQVSGRNDVDYETRVYFDAWYVKNWSLWNDIVILFKTIRVVLRKQGAY